MYAVVMSRTRVRATREQTRERLFEAAAEVFAATGIGAASIEAIAASAGLTRGAFYSNFADKDELVTAMLADHVEHTTRRYVELLARHRDPDDFMEALRTVDRSTQDPLGRSPLLHLELLLHAARAAPPRQDLTGLITSRRRIIVDIIEGTGMSQSQDGLDTEQLAAMLLAMEDGYRLHQLIDSTSTPPDSFLRSVSALQGLMRSRGGGRLQQLAD